MDLDFLLNQIKGAIFSDPTTPHREGHDPSGLIGQIEGLFGQFRGQQQQSRVLPASQDPYGDPAENHPVSGYGGNYGQQEYPNVRPASEDPLGDPADQQFRNIKPASEDPLGDPADLEPRR
jgi:hypothetical protein